MTRVIPNGSHYRDKQNRKNTLQISIRKIIQRHVKDTIIIILKAICRSTKILHLYVSSQIIEFCYYSQQYCVTVTTISDTETPL